RISGLMQKLGMEEGVPIEHGMVSRAIERAQKQVEAQNFSVRKHLLEYDDVMNKQRENIYALRRQILEGKIRLEDEDGEEEIVDAQWKDHLYSLDHLKEGIGLRGYGQRDPLVEYKKESFQLFQAMKDRVDEEIVRYLWWLRPVLGQGDEPPAPRPVRRQKSPL